MLEGSNPLNFETVYQTHWGEESLGGGTTFSVRPTHRIQSEGVQFGRVQADFDGDGQIDLLTIGIAEDLGAGAR